MILLINQFTFHYYFIITSIIFSKILAQQSYTDNSSGNKVYVSTYSQAQGGSGIPIYPIFSPWDTNIPENCKKGWYQIPKIIT